VSGWAGDIGTFLADGFEKGKAILFEYGPPFLKFVRSAKDEFLSIWKEAGPLVASIGESVKGFLNDPAAMHKLETFAKLYLAMKVGGGMGGGGGIGGAIGGAMQFGAVGYVAGGAVGGDAGADIGAGAGAGGKFGGDVAGAPGAVIGTAVGAVAGSLAFLGGGINALIEADRNYYASELDHNTKLNDIHGRIDTHSQAFADAVATAGENANWLSTIFESAASSMELAAARVNARRDQQDLADTRRAGLAKIDATLAEAQRISDAKKAEFAKADTAKKKKTAEGKGGMTINKVEITVSSNQAPDQVARATLNELAHLRRFRTSSSRTLNFSAGR
jgi:hypothetical protein